MKKILILLVLLWSIQGFSQALNGYKYLIVPAKFEFQKQENQYGINYLMEAYFKQQGFTVVFDKDITKEMTANPCRSIFSNVKRENNMFSTKITIELKDCEGKLLLVSSAGNSRSKEYDIAHKEAIRMALKSIPNQNYVFSENGIQKAVVTQTDDQDNVKGLIETKNKTAKNEHTLVVETLANGFLLIDSVTSKVVLKLYNTNSKNIFIAISNTKNGIVTRTPDKINFEYIIDNKVTTEILHVKF